MLLQNLGDKQNLLEIKMAPRETKNNASAKFGWQTKSIVVCYGIFWSGQLKREMNFKQFVAPFDNKDPAISQFGSLLLW